MCIFFFSLFIFFSFLLSFPFFSIPDDLCILKDEGAAVGERDGAVKGVGQGDRVGGDDLEAGGGEETCSGSVELAQGGPGGLGKEKNTFTSRSEPVGSACVGRGGVLFWPCEFHGDVWKKQEGQ